MLPPLRTPGATSYDEWKAADPTAWREPAPPLLPYDGPSHDAPPAIHHTLCHCGIGACWTDHRRERTDP
jgi:hypothetical protein